MKMARKWKMARHVRVQVTNNFISTHFRHPAGIVNRSRPSPVDALTRRLSQKDEGDLSTLPVVTAGNAGDSCRERRQALHSCIPLLLLPRGLELELLGRLLQVQARPAVT